MNYVQEEFIGIGQIKAIQNILKENNSKIIFLVTGKNSYHSCGAKSDLEKLLKDYEVVRFDDYSSNPKFNEALRGAELFKTKGCDFIICVGGGSAIDIAKTINVFQSHKGEELDLATGKVQVVNKLSPLCTVPTTAGTGSEATHFAVIYVDGKKYSLADETILPDYVVLDPKYTYTLIPYITACTGFDALSQAIESYWAKKATNESKQYASQAIQLLSENIEKAVNAPTPKERKNMLIGANLAGKAINISKTTAPHALSYAITSKTGLPHGHAVALTLGNFFILHSKILKQNHNELRNSEVFTNLYSMINVESAYEAKKWWYNLMKNCALNTNFSDFDLLTEDNIQFIVNQVNVERLGNHPLKLSLENLKSVFTE